ncbi:MAG: hydrogenase maturation nickel metallochaperone HypA [Candidatus Zixiibacteriota bacterium]
MHEYSVVQQLVEKLLVELARQGVTSVKAIHVRCGSTFKEEPLRQALVMLSDQTPLAGVEIVVDEYTVEHTCVACGHTETVHADDLIGHLFVCPSCGTPKEIEEAHGLQLVGVTV